MIRIGMIGCGYWGPKLARNLNSIEGSRVEYLCDTRAQRVEQLRGNFKDALTTSDHHEVIRSRDVDAVCIATPPATHYTMAMEAIEAGKHVFVEKPLAMHHSEALELMGAAEKKNVVLMTGHVFLYAPAVQAMRAMMQTGELGELCYVTSVRSNLPPPCYVVDVLWDLAPHDISIILDLVGEAPSEIIAQGTSFQQNGFLDAVFIVLRFPSGKMGHVHVSWLTPKKTRILHMVCKDGVAVYDDMQLAEKLRIHQPGPDIPSSGSGQENNLFAYGLGSITIPPLITKETLRAECEDFVRSIRTGEKPYASGRWAAEVVRVLEEATLQMEKQMKTPRVTDKVQRS